MNVDWTINMSTIITLALMIAGAIAAWVTLRNRVAGHEQKFIDYSTSLSAHGAVQKMLSDRVEEIRSKSAHELAEFKLEVAKNYATNNAIREVEERIVVAIDRLGDRLDKIIDGQGPRRPN